MCDCEKCTEVYRAAVKAVRVTEAVFKQGSPEGKIAALISAGAFFARELRRLSPEDRRVVAQNTRGVMDVLAAGDPS